MGPRRLIAAFFVVAILLGGIEAWSTRHQMNPNGIQYLDNADAYWSGDLRAALNAQWSPLYPWIIGAAFQVSRAPRMEQFAVVHVVNFLGYLASLAAFLFFLQCTRAIPLRENHWTPFLLLACSAFIYCSLDLTNLGLVTPDLLVSTFAFLTAGLLIRILDSASMKDHAALGIILGVGYLAKTPFFAFALLCVAMLWIRDRRRVWLTAALFAAISAPYVLVLSASKGRLTIGDSGRLNVVWMVNGVPYYNWQGGPAANGRPIHPARPLSASPDVLEFAAPIHATYPLWYDPSYWNDGVRVAWRAGDFASAVLREVRLYGYLIFHRQIPLLFAVVVLGLLAARHQLIQSWRPLWPLLVFSSAPFVMYAFVHAEGRYLAPFFVLLWSALALGVLWAVTPENPKVPLTIASVASILMLIAAIAAVRPLEPIRSAHDTSSRSLAPDEKQFQIATQLSRLGLKPGDPVAILTGDLPYSWARLVGARITMEAGVRNAQDWSKARAILERYPAGFVVAPRIEGVVNQAGWMELGQTGAYVYRICGGT